MSRASDVLTVRSSFWFACVDLDDVLELREGGRADEAALDPVRRDPAHRGDVEPGAVGRGELEAEAVRRGDGGRGRDPATREDHPVRLEDVAHALADEADLVRRDQVGGGDVRGLDGAVELHRHLTGGIAGERLERVPDERPEAALVRRVRDRGRARSHDLVVEAPERVRDR